jgi:hypothetical protein
LNSRRRGPASGRIAARLSRHGPDAGEPTHQGEEAVVEELAAEAGVEELAAEAGVEEAEAGVDSRREGGGRGERELCERDVIWGK